MNHSPAVLRAENLSKDYGQFRALDSLNISVKPGEVVGLLGPNGSGKTTALRLILGFLRPSTGAAFIGEHHCWHSSVAARKLVTYLPGELRLYENMTGRQLVHFLGKLRGEIRGGEVDNLAKRLDINPDTPLTQMSSGMKRKVALLAVLVPNVPLVILDEPTNALDPTMRDEFLTQLRLAKDAGKAVLFSSHVLQEVEAVCDRVAILRKGQLVHLQEMSELQEGRRVSAKFHGVAPTTGPDDKPLSVTQTANGRVELEHRGELGQLMAWLAGQQLQDVRIEPLGLSAIYRKYHYGT
jgi:ABC-2 type transport system ATP-binding protein